MKLSSADKAMFITFTGACLLVLVFFFLGVKPFENPNPEEEFIEIPVIQEIEEEQEEVDFKWDAYHQKVIAEHVDVDEDDDDWDDEDDDHPNTFYV